MLRYKATDYSRGKKGSQEAKHRDNLQTALGNHLGSTSYVYTTDMAISSMQPLLNHLAASVRWSPAHQTPPLPKAPRQGDMCLSKKHLTEEKLTENSAFHVRNFTLQDSDIHWIMSSVNKKNTKLTGKDRCPILSLWYLQITKETIKERQ